MENLLVIGDDRDLCELLAEYLIPEGFKVETACDGETGMEMFMNTRYGIVILDIMLPGVNSGFDVLQRLRMKSDTPIIVLTAKGDDVDRIVGLEMGADDYLSKPFNPRELLARIHAVLRRSKAMQDVMSGAAGRKYQCGDVVLDSGTRSVFKANKPVKLTHVEFQLMEILIRNYGKAVSRDVLAKEVLERPLSPYDRSIDVHMSKLRKKLGDDRGGSECIRAIRGTGYMYILSAPSEDEVVSC